MLTHVSLITLYVNDQEEALQFYVNKLGFIKRSDHKAGHFRWLTISTPGTEDKVQFALMVPSNDDEKQALGKQSYGLQSDDFYADYNKMKENGVTFISDASENEYRKEAAFQDLYGNKFVLIQKQIKQ
jgi:catechol 2,3-dioxygenase-like lactoylglutathione lyase family enzyme